MSKVNTDFKVPSSYDPNRIEDLFREISEQLNNLAEGRLNARYLARTSTPSAGSWAKGDVITNSTPTEAGTAGGMYVIMGWICTASGTPGTWKEMRVLTGN